MAQEGALLRALKRHCKAMMLHIVRLSFRKGVAAGWPDTLILIPYGCPLWMELKAPGKTLTPLQHHRIATLKALGYDVAVVSTIDEARTAIAQALERARVSARRCGPLAEDILSGAFSRPGAGQNFDSPEGF